MKFCNHSKKQTYLVSYLWEDWCNGKFQRNVFDNIIVEIEKFKFFKIIKRIEMKHSKIINGEKHLMVHSDMIKIISITNMDKL